MQIKCMRRGYAARSRSHKWNGFRSHWFCHFMGFWKPVEIRKSNVPFWVVQSIALTKGLVQQGKRDSEMADNNEDVSHLGLCQFSRHDCLWSLERLGAQFLKDLFEVKLHLQRNTALLLVCFICSNDSELFVKDVQTLLQIFIVNACSSTQNMIWNACQSPFGP